jgi:hypothetical protein
MIKKYRSFIKESTHDLKAINNLIDICIKYDIKDCVLNKYGTADVKGLVSLTHNELTKLPLEFDRVDGNFNCSYNRLLTLKGSPSYIGGCFYCTQNNLRSLVGGPTTVVGDLYCINNYLESFEGFPTTIGGNIDAKNNNIKSFKGFPELHSNDIEINLVNNPLSNIWSLFGDNVSAIQSLNDWEVIDTDRMEISYLRLSEVYEELGMEVPPRDGYWHIPHYKMID